MKAKNAFEIFQKHFLRSGRIFASATMFPCLRRPQGIGGEMGGMRGMGGIEGMGGMGRIEGMGGIGGRDWEEWEE